MVTYIFYKLVIILFSSLSVSSSLYAAATINSAPSHIKTSYNHIETFNMWKALEEYDAEGVCRAVAAKANPLEKHMYHDGLPIHYASRKSLDLVKALLTRESERQVNAIFKETGTTSLHDAIDSLYCEQACEIVEYLLQFGANPFIKDKFFARDAFTHAEINKVSLEMSLNSNRLSENERKRLEEAFKRIQDIIVLLEPYSPTFAIDTLSAISQVQYFPPGLPEIIISYLQPKTSFVIPKKITNATESGKNQTVTKNEINYKKCAVAVITAGLILYCLINKFSYKKI